MIKIKNSFLLTLLNHTRYNNIVKYFRIILKIFFMFNMSSWETFINENLEDEELKKELESVIQEKEKIDKFNNMLKMYFIRTMLYTALVMESSNGNYIEDIVHIGTLIGLMLIEDELISLIKKFLG